MDNLYRDKTFPTENIFDNRHIEIKSFYLSMYGTLPSVVFFGRLNGEKAYKQFVEQYGKQILKTHTYRWFNHDKKSYAFDRTVLVMDNECIVEFNDNYCEINHQESQPAFIEDVTRSLKRFKDRQKSTSQEINLIVKGYDGLELKPMEVKPGKLDLNLFYEDDFSEVDATIKKRLNKKNDKGIVLLHGMPGTGKTTYLRYLIGKIKKRVMFLSPDLAGSLTDPSFIQLLIDNPNSVMIIEDAENVIMDRRHSSSNAVSNLLNISDGLLADFLNVQLICTFNNSLTLVDSALMRKGRLIAKYEFGKLSVEKANVLSRHFGFDKAITEPMTIAELRNQHEVQVMPQSTTVIGFRNRELLAQ